MSLPGHGELHPRARGYMIATATAYGCMMFALILGPEEWSSTESYSLIGRLAPFWTWGCLFGVAAIAASISAFYNWPSLRLVVMPVVTGASAAWSVGLIAAGFTGRLEGVGAPIIWSLVTVLHYMEAARPSYVAPSFKRQIEEALEDLA